VTVFSYGNGPLDKVNTIPLWTGRNAGSTRHRTRIHIFLIASIFTQNIAGAESCLVASTMFDSRTCGRDWYVIGLFLLTTLRSHPGGRPVGHSARSPGPRRATSLSSRRITCATCRWPGWRGPGRGGRSARRGSTARARRCWPAGCSTRCFRSAGGATSCARRGAARRFGRRPGDVGSGEDPDARPPHRAGESTMPASVQGSQSVMIVCHSGGSQ